MIRILLSSLLLSASILAGAQDNQKERIQQLQEQRENERERKVRIQLDSGVYYMDQEEYEVADEKFRYALSNLKSVPSDLTFFFGKNSYLLGKHKQSIDWLTKYIQLKGTSGQYSTEAAEWLKKAEESLTMEHKGQAANAMEVLSRNYTIDCGTSGKVTCPVCSGSTVIVKKNYLGGDTYKTCPYCSQRGFLSCDDYNLLLRGQLKASGTPAGN